MTKVFTPNEWYRKDFSTVEVGVETPSLMKLQINSYKDFIQKDVPPAQRKDSGLQAVFKSVFPIFQQSSIPIFPPGRRPCGPEAI